MMEPANSANFTIAALLGSARPQQELIREAAAFHDQSLHRPSERSGLRPMIESDEEDEQESRISGKAIFILLLPFLYRSVEISFGSLRSLGVYLYYSYSQVFKNLTNSSVSITWQITEMWRPKKKIFATQKPLESQPKQEEKEQRLQAFS